MKYTVFYANTLGYSSGTPDSVPLSVYKKVATLDASDLEVVFRRMNVVDGDELPVKLKIRSLSVGDVVVDETGAAYYCAMVGWKRTEWSE